MEYWQTGTTAGQRLFTVAGTQYHTRSTEGQIGAFGSAPGRPSGSLATRYGPTS